MTQSQRQKDRFKSVIYSSLGAVLLGASILLLNYAASFLSLRLDLSNGKIYSVSDGTRQILDELEDPLFIQVYFSSPLPRQFQIVERYIRDLLVEYKRLSGGNVKTEFIDPNQSEEKKSMALQAGVAPVKLDIRRKDRQEIQESYMGMTLVYGDEKDTIPFISNSSGLEYEITSRIKKLIRPQETRIAVLEKENALNFESDLLKELGDAIKQIFTVENVKPGELIPGGVDSFWIIAPSSPMPQGMWEAALHKASLGATIGLLVDGFNVNVNSFEATPNDHGLDGFFERLGVRFRPALVVDPLADKIQVQSSQGFIRWVNEVSFPYFPLAVNLNREHPATKDVGSVSFPFVSPFEIVDPKPGFVYTPMAQSSEDSWLDENPGRVAPTATYPAPLEGTERGPFILSLLIEGQFSKEEGAPTGRILLLGSSKIIRNDFPPKPQNLSFFVNLLEWSAQEEALLSIRAKGAKMKPLKNIGDGARAFYKYLMVAGLPLLSVLVGLMVWRRQIKRRAKLKTLYGVSSL